MRIKGRHPVNIRDFTGSTRRRDNMTIVRIDDKNHLDFWLEATWFENVPSGAVCHFVRDGQHYVCFACWNGDPANAGIGQTRETAERIFYDRVIYRPIVSTSLSAEDLRLRIEAGLEMCEGDINALAAKIDKPVSWILARR